MFSSLKVLIIYITIYYIRIIKFYSIQLYKKTNKIIPSAKKIPIIEPPFFLNQFYKKITVCFTPAKKKPKNSTTIFPQEKIRPIPPKKETFRTENVTPRITSATWAMSESKSIYVRDNVYNIIQMIESRIKFNSHTTGLYQSQLCSK